MNLRRPPSPFVWKLCLTILVAGATACGGLLAGRQLKLRDAEERLVSAALALEADRFERPTHRAPARSGTFGEHAAPHLETLAAASHQLGELSASDLRLLASALRGAQPAAAAPERLRAMLGKCRPALHGLLAATHAEAARPPPALTAPGLDANAVAAVRLASRLVALEILDELEAGRSGRALDLCTDGLALARDLSHGSALAGRTLAAAVVAQLVAPCSRAIDAAPALAKREAIRQLQAIRDATPPFAAAVEEQRTCAIASTLGAELGQKSLRRLPPRFLETASRAAPVPGHLARAAWLTIEAAWDGLVAAQALGREAGSAAQAGLRRRLSESRNPVAASAAAALDLTRFEAEDRMARTQLELLIHAAALDLRRVESGRWPQLLAELEPQVSTARADAVREASLLYFVSEAEQAATLEGGDTALTLVTVTADREVSR